MGWLANGSAAHPVVTPAADCGNNRVGVINLGVRKNLSECWDAYCYRVQGMSLPPTPAYPRPLNSFISLCERLIAFPADVACQCRVGFVGDGISTCNGKLLDVLAATANFSTFYGVCRGPSLRSGNAGSWDPQRESLPIASSPHPQMLLGYANATQRGLDFMDFLDDELTYKTLFVPVNEGFMDNMVTRGAWAVCSLQQARPNKPCSARRR